jgi:threonine aldolase
VAKPIDLRSDTVTKPSDAMRRAMADAEVGDDWYGDDPTVNLLQDRCAEVTGKDDAVYVATGTLANQIALHSFVGRGHFAVCEANAHVATVEVTTSAMLSGIAFHGIATADGTFSAEQAAAALEPDPLDVDIIDLLQVENTHQVGGGTPWDVDELRRVRKVAQEREVPVYMDGARLFNASVATGTPVGDYTAQVDAVMFCLSKGLGAPIGSVLCGSAEFVTEARRTKILFGGAWRQAGIMAAAGLVALGESPKRLYEDHENARRLAQGIAEVTPGAIDPAAVPTNILFVDTGMLGHDPVEVWKRMGEEGVLANVVAGKIRLVTHVGVTADDIEETISVWRRIAADTQDERKRA